MATSPNEGLGILITPYITKYVSWVIANSPNTIITILCFFGTFVLLSLLMEGLKKGLTGVVYIYAICIYLPYCYIKDKYFKKEI